MRTTLDFLDAVKARHGLPSDYALAKKLGVTHQMISRYRTGKELLGDLSAIKVASLLEIDSGIVMAAVHAERAKSDQERTAWNAIFEKLGGIAAALLIGIGGMSAPSPAQASSAPISAQSGNGIGIMSTRRRYAKGNKLSLLPLELLFLRRHPLI